VRHLELEADSSAPQHLAVEQDQPMVLVRDEAGAWSLAGEDCAGAPWNGGKGAQAGGPLRQAFGHGFVLVYGTGGDEAMDRALLEQARFDAQRWMYRAHGQGVLLPDTGWRRAPRDEALEARNVILYGNRFSNRLLGELDGPEHPFPLRLAGVGVRLGERVLAGPDQAAYGVLPGPAPHQLLGVMGSTSARASRLGFTTMLFVSGAGWPDYVVFDEGVLETGDGGVRAAGWFDYAWRVQAGGFLREGAGVVSPK
jgi:hypothetical protein